VVPLNLDSAVLILVEKRRSIASTNPLSSPASAIVGRGGGSGGGGGSGDGDGGDECARRWWEQRLQLVQVGVSKRQWHCNMWKYHLQLIRNLVLVVAECRMTKKILQRAVSQSQQRGCRQILPPDDFRAIRSLTFILGRTASATDTHRR
jgi:hypothetical protein